MKKKKKTNTTTTTTTTTVAKKKKTDRNLDAVCPRASRVMNKRTAGNAGSEPKRGLRAREGPKEELFFRQPTWRKKMATSIEYDMVAAVENEISCPVCWEDFEEPKSLPNCAHNVCQLCLEGMVKKRNESIECPVCRVESIIPKGGVAAFPKNHLLVRLIEQTPGYKEKKRIKEAVKMCEEKVEGAKTAIKDLEDHFETAKIQDEEIVQEIKSLAEVVVTKVREQEQKMLSQIKNRQICQQKLIQTLKSDTMKLCENSSGCIKTLKCILQNFESKNLKDVSCVSVEELNEFTESLEMCMLEANCEFTQQFSVLLTGTDIVKKFIEDECLLGELTINSGRALAHQVVAEPASVPSVSEATPSPSGIDFSRCGSLIQTIDSSSCGIAQFIPFSVAVSRNSGHIVVLDEQRKWVHIFDEEGEPLNKFRIKFGDLWDVAVSNENEIVVVNRESNRLLHYDMNGNFKKKFLTAAKENVKFSSLSIDIHGRFIISSCYYSDTDDDDDDVTSCILVYSPSGNLTLSFGEEILSVPAKAVFLNGKFFVTDFNLGKVVVFDKNGIFLETFGVCELEDPFGIAADHINGNLVVCERKKNAIYIYSQTGRLRHHFQTMHKPIEVAFTKNYKKLLICCDSQDDDKSYLQIVTYL